MEPQNGMVPTRSTRRNEGTQPAYAKGGQCALPPRAGAPHEGTWPANATGDQGQSLMAQILHMMWILTFAIGDWGELNDRRLRKANDKKGEGKTSGASPTVVSTRSKKGASKLKTWQERRKIQIGNLAQKLPHPDADSSGGENRTPKTSEELAQRRSSKLRKIVRGAGPEEELQIEKLTQKLPGPDADSSDGERALPRGGGAIGACEKFAATPTAARPRLRRATAAGGQAQVDRFSAGTMCAVIMVLCSATTASTFVTVRQLRTPSQTGAIGDPARTVGAKGVDPMATVLGTYHGRSNPSVNELTPATGVLPDEANGAFYASAALGEWCPTPLARDPMPLQGGEGCMVKRVRDALLKKKGVKKPLTRPSAAPLTGRQQLRQCAQAKKTP
jgi:hypothetical protein